MNPLEVFLADVVEVIKWKEKKKKIHPEVPREWKYICLREVSGSFQSAMQVASGREKYIYIRRGNMSKINKKKKEASGGKKKIRRRRRKKRL